MENKTFHQKTRTFYKSHALELITASFSFVVIAFVGVLPCFFYYPLFVLTLPFIICPGVLGLHLVVNMIEYKQGLPRTLILIGYPQYFGLRFRGAYRVIIGTLKSLLAFFAVLIATSVIYTPIATNVDPEFVSVMDQIAKVSTTGDMETLDVLLRSACVLRYVATVFLFATLAFMIIFVRHLGIHEQNVSFRAHVSQMIGGENRLFVSFYSSGRSDIKRSLKGVLWMEILVFALGYFLGAGIAYSIFLDMDIRVPMIALIGGLAALGFYLPYFDHYSNLANYYYSLSFREYILATMVSEVERYRELNPNEAELPDVLSMMEQTKQELENQKQGFDGHDYPPDRGA